MRLQACNAFFSLLLLLGLLQLAAAQDNLPTKPQRSRRVFVPPPPALPPPPLPPLLPTGKGSVRQQQLQHVVQDLSYAARRHDTLLVTLANGHVVALNRDTGARLWTFSGAPLFLSSGPHAATGDGGECD